MDSNCQNPSRCCSDFPVSDKRAEQMAAHLKALSHPVRLKILQHLGRHNQRCCSDFCENIPLAQSTISQHLKILNDAGFIQLLSEGNYSRYSLNLAKLGMVIDLLNEIHEFADQEHDVATQNPELDKV